MNELLKIVRYSNLFDLNHLMDAIDSINDETRSSLIVNDETASLVTTSKDLFLIQGKNYRGRLSKSNSIRRRRRRRRREKKTITTTTTNE
jgi:hypothetical protein